MSIAPDPHNHGTYLLAQLRVKLRTAEHCVEASPTSVWRPVRPRQRSCVVMALQSVVGDFGPSRPGDKQSQGSRTRRLPSATAGRARNVVARVIVENLRGVHPCIGLRSPANCACIEHRREIDHDVSERSRRLEDGAVSIAPIRAVGNGRRTLCVSSGRTLRVG